MRTALVGAGVGAGPGLASPRIAVAAETREAEGPTCRIVGHDVPQEGVDGCRDGLEAAAPLLASTVPWRLPKDEKLVVHLYGDLETYAAAMRAADAPELADNWASTLYATRESHVVFQPRGGAALRALAGEVPEYTLWQIVHEAVHQLLARSGVATYDLWPAWLEEGLCEEVAARAVSARQRPGVVPVALDDRRHLVVDALARGQFLGLDRLLYTRVQAFVPERAAYAHAGVVRTVPRRRPGALPCAPREGHRGPAPAARPAGGAAGGLRKAFAALLVEVYGPLAPLEARWRAAVAAERPRWFEPTRSAQWLPDGGLLQASYPKGSAQTVATAPVPAGGYVVTGMFRILAAGDGDRPTSSSGTRNATTRAS